MKTQIFRGALAALIAGALLAGCGGVSEMTKDRVARSESAVRQAQETVGNSEQGALELQKARDHLQQARQALLVFDYQDGHRCAVLLQSGPSPAQA